MCVNASNPLNQLQVPVCAAVQCTVYVVHTGIQEDFDRFTHISLYSTNTQRFKATDVNRTLPSLYEGSLEITHTVPLKGVTGYVR